MHECKLMTRMLRDMKLSIWLNRYTHLDTQKNKIQDAKKAAPDQSFAASLQERINSFGGEDKLNWIYGNDIEEVWREFVDNQEAK